VRLNFLHDSLLIVLNFRQERITTTKKGSITSAQTVYVPADDSTDPAPAATFAHLDATTVLSRSIAELDIYPAVDPLDSKPVCWTPALLARNTTKSLPPFRKFSRTTSLQYNIPVPGVDELPEEDDLKCR
jgi:F0F1-type ATP synthase beta subunit